jgi:hypothetical protein
MRLAVLEFERTMENLEGKLTQSLLNKQELFLSYVIVSRSTEWR